MRLYKRCGCCGGRGWYATGGRRYVGWGDVDDDIEEMDCWACHGTGCGTQLWPVVWLWRRIRRALRWVSNMLRPAEGIPF